MSKLGQWCAWVVEGGWLIALAIVPLYFDVYTSRVFEPDKTTFLRGLVLLMLLAQALVLSEQAAGSARSGRPPPTGAPATAGRPPSLTSGLALFRGWANNNPLLLPVLASAAVELVATVTSIDPAQSLFGSYQRLQGTYTLFTYVALFLLVAVNLREREQVGRLINVVVLTSIPICLYGLLQHLQLDPLPWGGDVAFRVTSTMGNAIFLAAYLIMVAPFTAARLVGTLRDANDPHLPVGGSPRPVVWRWTAVLATQSLVLALLLLFHATIAGIWWGAAGLMAWVTVLIISQPAAAATRRLARIQAVGYALLLALQILVIFLTQSRGPWLGLFAGAVVFVLLLEWWSPNTRRLLGATIGLMVAAGLVLVVFNLPQSPLARFRNVPYVGRLGQLTAVQNGTGRVRVLIWQGTYQLLTHYPSIGFSPDPLHLARPLLGYGPESMQLAYNPVYPPALGDLESRNASPDRNHNDLLDHLVMTGVLGLLAYLALVLLALRLCWQLFRRATSLTEVALIAGLAAALVAHLAETQTGIAIVSTRTYFYTILAVLVALAVRPALAQPAPTAVAGGAPAAARPRKRPRPPAPGRAATRPPQPRSLRPWIIGGAYLGVIVVGQVIVSTVAPANAQVLMDGSFLWLALALPVWAAMRGLPGNLLVVPPRTRVVAIAGAAIVVIGVTLNLNQLAADVYHKEGTSLDAQGNFANSAHAYQEAIALAPQQDYYYLFLGRAYLELAKQAPKTPLSPPFSPTLDNALTVPPATIEQMGQIDALRSAEVVLERARYLAPLNPDHYANLARLYRLWGETIDPSKLADSSHYSRLATTLSPHSAQLFDEWALTLLAEGKLPEALVEARTAAALDPQYAVTHVVLGDVYLNQHQVSDALAQHFQALALDPTALSDSSFEARVQAYVAAGQGRALADRYGALLQSHPSRPVRLAYAYLLTQTGQTALALPQFQILVQQDPTDWLAQRDLAIADEQLGHRTGARAAAQAALQAAPADQRSSIQSLLTSLGAS